MRAARVHTFGPPGVIVIDHVASPSPGPGGVLVRVRAAGVGPWDAWIRSGKSVLPQPLPLTLGSDLCGFVEAVGSNVTTLGPGDAVYGVTNPSFTGACADFAVASAERIAKAPRTISPVEAASVPVVAVSAWQMLFDHAKVTPGQTVLVLGGAGNVGAFAVQLAHRMGVTVLATAGAAQVGKVRDLGADDAIDVAATPLSDLGRRVDAVIDTVGGALQAASFGLLKPGGALVSTVSQPDPQAAQRLGVRARFILVDVTSALLNEIAAMIDGGALRCRVGDVLALEEIVVAHEMLEGLRPHAYGKIVLRVTDI